MSLFERFGRLIRSLISDYIRSVEDPALLADEAIRLEEDQLATARRALASIIASRKSTTSRLRVLRLEADNLQACAERVFQSGRTNRRALAERYLLARRACLDQIESLQSFRDSQLEKEEDFQCRLIEGEMKLQEAKRRHAELLARMDENRIRAAINSVDNDLTAGQTQTAGILDRLEERVAAEAHHLDACDELSQQTLEKRIEEIRRPSLASELDELESRFPSSGENQVESPQIGSGEPVHGLLSGQGTTNSDSSGRWQPDETVEDCLASLLD